MDFTKFRYYFLVRSRNGLEYFDRCIDSILSQRGNYTILFVDDCSDYTRGQRQYIQRKLKGHVVVFNKERKYAIRNAYEIIHTYVDDDAVILNVDGDDWLAHDHVLSTVGRVYAQSSCLLTYGNCRYYNPDDRLHGAAASDHDRLNHRYPPDIESRNMYRKYYYRALHLRTWKSELFKEIHKSSFLHSDKTWQRVCEDESMYIPMLEMAGGRYEVIREIMYIYNKHNIFSENMTTITDHLMDEITILRQKPYLKL